MAQNTPRISAFAMRSLKKQVHEDTPPIRLKSEKQVYVDTPLIKLQSESARSIFSENEEPSLKRRINTEEILSDGKTSEVVVVQKRGRKKKQATVTSAEKENMLNEPEFDVMKVGSDGNHFTAKEPEVLIPKKRKDTNKEPEVIVLKKRGRKRKINDTIPEPDVVVPKKRGRKKKIKDTIKEPEVLVPKKRGRKKKMQEDTIEVLHEESKFCELEFTVKKIEEYFNESIDISPAVLSSSKKQRITCGNEAAEEVFQWLLSPVNPKTFFEEKFEKLPLLVQRSNRNYYKGLFSTKEFDEIMKENDLNYDVQIDVLAYVDGERRPIQNDMKVFPPFVWNAYLEGNSIRMRNPQTYHKALGNLCSLLQEYFSSYVGANMYLTPAGTQGFPPHYDDIDAFILQIEGKKLWKLYKPRDESEVLSRLSSADMTEDEIGEPCMEVELEAGDMLYFPRGFIHQAKAAPGVHSLHLTISANQLNTYGDFLQAGLSHALEQAMQNDVEFRKSLPKDYIDFVGCTYANNKSVERTVFKRKVEALAEKALKYFSVDYAADAHAMDFIHASLPPFFNGKEKACSIHGRGTRFVNGQVIAAADLTLHTKIRLIRKRAFRLVMDEKNIRLFYTLANNKNYKEGEPLFVDVDLDVVPAINALFKSHPNFVKIIDLPHENSETKMEFAKQLYENGFLMTENPLS
ncbi:ribosomal oxygenase 1 [Nephila pilipes]|uniref:Bifunctional lysine-specific demethylase and histidyl-hydroxylase n=1 Tax=Nephila pilipes TaxID=299642 RepID=A0A8X6Q9L2_NEPPI|nr:ribosomal oxygenase 1 [Nephila pilipes]